MAKKKKAASSSSSSSSSDKGKKSSKKAAASEADPSAGGRGAESGRDAPPPAAREEVHRKPAEEKDAEASATQRSSQAESSANKPFKPEDLRDKELVEYAKRKISQVESLEKLGRSGGVYIPPFKLARMQEEIEDKTSPEFQRQAWEALRKSLNGLVNKVNAANIKSLVEELFQENLLRGRGLLVRSIVRAQMASPGFTHVFAALVAVINSKLPDVGDLVLRRVILQFRRAYKRNDKIVTIAAIKFMAHLVNQKVASELLALHVATLLLERITDDSIEVCVSFMQEVGHVLQVVEPVGSHAIYERFRTILHEGQIDRRVQYVIEGYMKVCKDKFKDFPGVVEELDLVEEDDQITHEIDLLNDTIKGEEALNIFKTQPPEEYAADEAKWKHIAGEILGLDEDGADSDDSSEDSEDGGDEPAATGPGGATTVIHDFTEQDLVNLRRNIYLVIMSSLHFEECVHKILKLNIGEGQDKEVCTMLLDCCAMEKTFNRFFALQAERLCRLVPTYQERFAELFDTQLNLVHRLETNKIRNLAKFFAHLLYTDAITWNILSQVRMSEETTTSSSRIFIKGIFQELCEQWGIEKLSTRMSDPTMESAIGGLFPKDNPKNMRFAINYFTAIGLGVLTEDLRRHLQTAQVQMKAKSMEEASTASDDSDSSSSSSSS